MGKLGNIVSAIKMFLNLLGNIFDSWEVNFVSATMSPEVGRQGNIDRNHNVSATMFPEVGRQGNIDRKHNVSATMFPCLPWV